MLLHEVRMGIVQYSNRYRWQWQRRLVDEDYQGEVIRI